MSKNNILLNDSEISEIKDLAQKTRLSFGVYQAIPIGNDIRLLLESKGVYLCEYPFSDSEGTHTYGNITWFKTDKEEMTFIGLNTASYFDEQVFALAHEIYHFSTRTGMAYSQDMDYEDDRIEKKADRFAAELLLPEEALRQLVRRTFYKKDLVDEPVDRLLRFAASIHSDWWIPYQSIIIRLFEESIINSDQFKLLFDIDCRSENGVYRRILKSIDSENSVLLNKRTRNIGISKCVLETIINNYEDGFIDDDEFIKLLRLFNKCPEDYGFDISVEVDEDIKDLFLDSETNDED